MLARLVGDVLVLFCIVDDHMHVVVCAEEHRLRQTGRSLLLATQSLASTELQRPHVTNVEGRRHLERLVDYLLAQTDRHGLSEPGALWSGSCFQDLVGARSLPNMKLRVGELLPRFRLHQAHAAVGLASTSPTLDDAAIRRLGAGRILDAAASVHAAGPELDDRSTPSLLARVTAAHLAKLTAVANSEISWALGLSPRSVRRLLAQDVPTEALGATRVRLELEEAFGTLRRERS